MITDLAIALALPLLGNKPKKFDFVHQTVSHREARGGVGTKLHGAHTIITSWFLEVY